MKKRRGAILVLALLSLLVFTISAAFAAATIPFYDDQVAAGTLTEVIDDAPFNITEISFELNGGSSGCISHVNIEVDDVDPPGGLFDVYVAIKDSSGTTIGDGFLDEYTINSGDVLQVYISSCPLVEDAHSIYIAAAESG